MDLSSAALSTRAFNKRMH